MVVSSKENGEKCDKTLTHLEVLTIYTTEHYFLYNALESRRITLLVLRP